MSNKFRYAPGRPGFGTRGDDGSAGLPGLAIYFTDYDITTSSAAIRTAIANNRVLWSADSSTTSLPEGRTYQTGDLFVDRTGGVYEIDAENDTFEYKFASLNTAGYFTSAEVASDTYVYNRYFNNNVDPKYIIDNVYADGEINYFDVPSTIYGITPQNFARIEYSNIEQGNYNPFTLYSSGEIGTTDDHKSLAIVRETASNTFRLGNLDSNNNVRNVNLVFDISSLKVNKESGGLIFKNNTPTGTILTNYEIDANSLFTGNFNINPATFKAVSAETVIGISWIKTDFTTDTDVTADLYFFKDTSVNNQIISMSTDASSYRPIILYNCTNAGTLTLNNLSPITPYKYYMVFTKNGWTRRSVVKSTSTTPTPNITIIPTAYTNEASVGHVVGFCVSSNIIWDASATTNPGNFLSDISYNGDTLSQDASLYVTLSNNTADDPRQGIIRVRALNATGTPKYATITQRGASEPITVDISSLALSTQEWEGATAAWRSIDISINGLPIGTYVDVSVTFAITLNNGNNVAPLFETQHYVDASLSAPGKTSSLYNLSYIMSPPAEGGPTNYYTTYGYAYITDVSISNVPLTVYMRAQGERWMGEHSCYESFGTAVQLIGVTVKYRSGTRVSAVYDWAQGGYYYITANYYNNDCGGAGEGEMAE